MLALRGSGGYKAGGKIFHFRVSAPTENVAKATGFEHFSKKIKVAVAAVPWSPPPHRAAATATFFRKTRRAAATARKHQTGFRVLPHSSY